MTIRSATLVGSLAMLMIMIVACAWLFVTGMVIVRDADRSVAGVDQQGGVATAAMARWPGGLYVSPVKIEGEAIVRCANGLKVSLGYVTGGMTTSHTMHARDCGADAPAVINP